VAANSAGALLKNVDYRDSLNDRKVRMTMDTERSRTSEEDFDKAKTREDLERPAGCKSSVTKAGREVRNRKEVKREASK